MFKRTKPKGLVWLFYFVEFVLLCALLWNEMKNRGMLVHFGGDESVQRCEGGSEDDIAEVPWSGGS